MRRRQLPKATAFALRDLKHAIPRPDKTWHVRGTTRVTDTPGGDTK